MWEGLKRRKFPRAKYKCAVTLKSESDKPTTFSTATENIGMGGICVILKDEVELFKNVSLELTLEDNSPPVKCEGTVVWVVKKIEPPKRTVSGYDTGIEFTEISEADRGRIGAIVEKILSQLQRT